MKEALKVDIGGIVFLINKEAYAKLDTYLNKLTAHYSKGTEGQEIMGDIEARIAELLLERKGKEQAVTAEDVEYIISVMGAPSAIEAEEGEGREGSANTAASASTKESYHRRLYREKEGRFLGGVCGGLGHYFKIDPTLIRICVMVYLAIVIFLARGWSGIGWTLLLVSYGILWICMPLARTVAEKCAMRGTDPGLKGVENERNNPVEKKSSPLGRAFIIVLGAIFIAIGVALMITAICCISITQFTAELQIPDFVNIPSLYKFLLSFCGSLVVILPCLALIYGGAKIIWKLKPRVSPLLIALILWIIAFIGVIGASINIGFAVARHISKSKIHIEQTTTPAVTDTLASLDSLGNKKTVTITVSTNKK